MQGRAQRLLSARNRRARKTIISNIGGRWLQWKENYTQNTIEEVN